MTGFQSQWSAAGELDRSQEGEEHAASDDELIAVDADVVAVENDVMTDLAVALALQVNEVIDGLDCQCEMIQIERCFQLRLHEKLKVTSSADTWTSSETAAVRQRAVTGL